MRKFPLLFLAIFAVSAGAQSSHDRDPSAQSDSSNITLSAHPSVALTFDDLPAAGVLPTGDSRARIAQRLSSELRAAGLTGTYGFINAAKLANASGVPDPDAQQALRIWVSAGMNLGNHTWSHIPLTKNTPEAFEAEIARNEPTLTQYAGSRDWHWFRYPFLWEGDTLQKRHAVRDYLQEHHYRIAQVTLDFEDYAWNDAYSRCAAKQDNASITRLKRTYLETAAEYIALGRKEQVLVFGNEIPGVMLLHATAFTTLMLPDLITQLKSEGFTFTTLPQAQEDPAYALDPDAPLPYGGTLPDQFMDARHLKYPPFKHKPFDELAAMCK
jgi:peptidoglycan/xylan/chitin deacetylase (PgdA/CDA1 family)